MKKFKPGNVVSTAKHLHKMTIHEILSHKRAICQYFIGFELHTEVYYFEDISLISD